MKKLLRTASFLFFFFLLNVQAQDESSHEIGFISGSASFTTDYGQRNHFMSNVGGNVGFGMGLIYYYNFTDYRYRWNERTNYWAEHFRVRGELSYMAAELDHFGEWINAIDGDTGQISEWAQKLRDHHGKTYLINLGAQLEFHIVDIVDFGSRRIPDLQWSPYASIGVFTEFYNPSVNSDAGNWRDPGVLYPKWDINDFPTAVRDTPGITMSVTMGVGTRKKLSYYSDIVIESRWQYFFSNYVDGLHARQDSANKFNDWLLWVHVGYIYYLN